MKIFPPTFVLHARLSNESSGQEMIPPICSELARRLVQFPPSSTNTFPGEYSNFFSSTRFSPFENSAVTSSLSSLS